MVIKKLLAIRPGSKMIAMEMQTFPWMEYHRLTPGQVTRIVVVNSFRGYDGN